MWPDKPKRCRHTWGQAWGNPTLSHASYCGMTGAHLAYTCEKCGAKQLWCPERGRHYFSPVGKAITW